MSRKNHEMIDGKLLQTDKKYAQLKLKQKEKIAEWMFQATRDYYMKKYTFPNDKHLEGLFRTFLASLSVLQSFCHFPSAT